MNESFISRYLRFSGKVLIIVIPIFIIVGIIVEHCDTQKCGPLKKQVRKKLDYIANIDSSITKIRLEKSSPGWEVNLIDSNITITNKAVISQLRTMLINKKREDWNHPIREWDVLLILDLANNEQLNILVRKIENDTIASMTHLYFMFDGCTDDYPNSSLDLGVFLEKLTDYNGKTYK